MGGEFQVARRRCFGVSMPTAIAGLALQDPVSPDYARSGLHSLQSDANVSSIAHGIAGYPSGP